MVERKRKENANASILHKVASHAVEIWYISRRMMPYLADRRMADLEMTEWRRRGMIGDRIKSLRRIRKMTLKQLADQTGVSEGHMSKIENDKTQPSVAALHRITQSLDVTIGILFNETDGEDQPISRVGERPVINLDPVRRGTGIRLERIIPHSQDHILQCNIHIIEPGGSSEDQIQHMGEEMGYVLDGELELFLDDAVYHLGKNDSFHFNSMRKHAYRNPGKTQTRILWANTPPTF